MEGQHFSQIIKSLAGKYGEKTALCSRKNPGDEWTALTWNGFEKQVAIVAKALLELGVKELDRVGQFSQNMAENLIVDFAVFANRGTIVPMYATSSASQVEFIVNDAEIELIFVGDQIQYNVALEVLKNSKILKKIVVLDRNVELVNNESSMYYDDLVAVGTKSTKHYEVENRQQDALDEDLACILYTSGTTGNPKGVMMPHSCFIEAMRTHTMRLTSVTENDISVAFLPLSHVFERTWCYFCISKGVTIYINLKPLEIQQTIKEIRPTLMCAVPRFWEKVYAGVKENISKMSPLQMGIVTWAVETGKKHNIDHLRIGKKPGALLSLKYKLADKLIFSKVKETIGIENANLLPTAGARLSDEITLFMRSIGVPITYGYGLTESTATVCCFDYVNYEVGTVGKIMPDLQVRLGEENEIQLRGKTIFPGYYKNKAATQAAFTEDGWFKTGDAGIIKGDQLVMTERLKDLFKTSNGKYIAPQEIETRLGMDRFIEQVAVIGDERNFVTAIIVPSIPVLEEYAKKNNLKFDNIDDLLASEEIYKMYEKRIVELQSGMANYEKIKKFRFIKKGFTIESGELTNTLKMRRVIIMQKYKAIIDEMYAV
ncbi:MAG TPA: long-chain fatty acid--CoA ligase [Paludibacter sp.]|nr:long-chain fatty acid--CoA ligase [Paludibacter sp.]